MTFSFISYQEFIEDCKEFIQTLPKFPKVSYIPRSGIIPAFMYSKQFNSNLIPLKQADKNTLVFDDSVRFGRKLNEVQKSSPEPTYAVIYYSQDKGMNYKLDFKYKFIETPRLFEWNWINQEHIINRACFDFDGVLCHFPREDLSSGKIDYKEFLKNAIPKFIPDYEIGAICTGRLEKYRKETEEWLKKHNVKYRKLLMVNATEEERMMNRLHTKPKIEEYSKMGYVLFVEDETYQALQINHFTNKPVLDVTKWKIYK